MAADHLAFHGIGRYSGSTTSTKLKVTGVDVFSAGNFIGGSDTEAITLADPVGGVYKKLIIKDDKLIGACLYGDTVDGAWYFRLIREAKSISELREHLMFGESSIGDSGRAGENSIVGNKLTVSVLYQLKSCLVDCTTNDKNCAEIMDTLPERGNGVDILSPIDVTKLLEKAGNAIGYTLLFENADIDVEGKTIKIIGKYSEPLPDIGKSK